ncbi:MAG: hypothetical protein ACI8XO_001640 [Verrucomicrobiales bacterium]|jgi:hypothetical protein
MKTRLTTLFVLLAALVAPAGAALDIHAVGKPDMPAKLLGPDATLQLVVTRDGATDFTHLVEYRAEPAGLVTITPGGKVTPLADGLATVTAVAADGGESAQVQVAIESCATPQPINFSNDIVPLFTKHGCNSGGCHGKSEGQNGFRLSLLGFEPTEDYEYLVKESRGRRLFPAAPDHSLLLRKAIGDLPHGGGARVERDSWDYRAIVRWMEQGMPYGSESDPTVEKISVFPELRIVAPGAKQQLAVTAHYSDGTLRDVTEIVTYESNQKEMAEVELSGLVTMLEGQTGDTAVMIRFQEQVTVFQATIPLGAPTDSLPAERNFIDGHVFAKLRILGLPASELCDDTTFLRRSAIDIAGRLPTLEEAEAYQNDTRPDKRAAWVDTLLAGTDYADYFANKWVSMLRNKRKNGSYARGTQAFHEWIRGSLHENKPYDQLARELVTATGEIAHNPAAAWFRNVPGQKEQLQDTAQVFLGVRLQCAECHHHPYEKWSQQDYYGFQAFFSRVGKKKSEVPGEDAVFHNVGIASANNPKTKQNVKPTPLGGEALDLPAERDPRQELATWMTSKDNEFFARMLVNRYWKHFFNRALVEPEDDMRVTNPPTNPALLDALASNFVESNFDLKALVRTICNSTAYQLSAIPNEHNAGDRQNYSRYFPKRLNAEVLLDSIDSITGSPTSFAGQLPGTRAIALPDDSYNSSSYFLTVFGRPEMDSACECERAEGASLAQTLHLLNSKNIQDKLAAGAGNAARLSGDAARQDREKISELYHRAFARTPVDSEVQIAAAYLDKKRSAASTAAVDVAAAEKLAWEDLVWALLNTKEFLFNH